MEIIGLKKGQVLAKKNDPVKEWYIIQEGEVIQKNDFVETRLGVNSIIGMLEQDFFICDYSILFFINSIHIRFNVII